MIYLEHIPPHPLSDYVDRFWYCRDYCVPHTRERVLPSGCLQLIFNLDKEFTPVLSGPGRDRVDKVSGCLVSGVHSEYVVIDTTTLTEMIGIHFRPGGAASFLRMPLHRLTDVDVPLESVWRGSRELWDRLREPSTPQQKFRLLEQSLRGRADGCTHRSSAVASALDAIESDPTQDVHSLVRASGCSTKRFLQLFRDEVGLTPKLYCRIRRFQRSLRLAAASMSMSWAELAAECGYFDQAHFVRDFKSFSGINPTSYINSRAAWINHVPVL